jgi:hypothetical protein
LASLAQGLKAKGGSSIHQAQLAHRPSNIPGTIITPSAWRDPARSTNIIPVDRHLRLFSKHREESACFGVAELFVLISI